MNPFPTAVSAVNGQVARAGRCLRVHSSAAGRLAGGVSDVPREVPVAADRRDVQAGAVPGDVVPAGVQDLQQPVEPGRVPVARLVDGAHRVAPSVRQESASR